MTRSACVSLFLLLALATAGCGSRVTMTPSHSRAYRHVFARQAVNPAGTARMAKGLDALEATIVVDTYRKQLAPSGGRTADQRMVVFTPGAGALGTPAAPAR